MYKDGRYQKHHKTAAEKEEMVEIQQGPLLTEQLQVNLPRLVLVKKTSMSSLQAKDLRFVLSWLHYEMGIPQFSLILCSCSSCGCDVHYDFSVAVDIKKLREAGLCTVEAVLYSPRKDLSKLESVRPKLTKLLKQTFKVQIYLE
ncbi:hypothetical protein HPP92_016655 [Vanilla planifolia]|uniref:Uncharacterized protein n=1 Tax=Vanilla planifolia TaxID=51239 RepID=A0A835QBA2_VANPL|nr:hypothetical protein HPP92_016655 [Vanilla planifolia]